ncbi:collagen-like protein [Aquimarina addita]
MKTTLKFLTYFTMAFALIITSISCEGEDGMDGADGVQGVAGADGADGQNGADGTDGEDGNANVISISFDAYAISTGQNEFEVPELTQEIYDNGFVYGYTTVNGNAFWETLPIVIGGETRLDIDRIEVGKIILTSLFDQTLDFRFVLVAGNDVNAVDFSNYYEVESFLKK